MSTPALIRSLHALRWRDLDAFNHVNNSTFLTYLEETRLQWFARLDGEWMGEHCMPVVAAVHVNYRAQLGWPGEVAVELSCERVGNTSVSIGHRIVAADDSAKLYSDGNVVLVWVDPATGKPVALPAAVRDACAPR